MEPSTDFKDFIFDQLQSWRRVRIKRMFGCVGLYADDLMFGIIAKEVIFFKVDKSNISNYLEADSQPLKLFKNESKVLSFYEVPIEVLEDANQFVHWAEESLNIQKNKSK
ncbi:TfoX/Sxy family protein [Zobellia nedashkovskayae]|uniref:TfoX/Sxy family protein n=1 Tax=Zobellia nedashkovskayae TaxID=2779510 RepID=UPI00188B9091|nr:TfoX/Sxy family protein [Zobellia nedashkovskayae]